MPTTLATINNGDALDPAGVNKFIAPVNNLEKGLPFWAGTTGGTSTAFTATVSPTPGANTAGTVVSLKLHAANGVSPTLSLNGNAALPILSQAAAPALGALVINTVLTLVTDGTYWHVIGDGVGAGGSTNASTAFSSGQLPLARGGSGADLSATGGANQFVRQNSAGGTLTVSAIAAADLPNHSAALLTSGTLAVAQGGAGGSLAATGGANQFVKQTSAGAALTVAVIATADLGTGTADATTFLRGDKTWAVPSGGASWKGCVLSISGTSSSLPATTLTTLSWNYEIISDAALHSTSTNPSRLIADSAGKWELNVMAMISDGGATCSLRVYINGSTDYSYQTQQQCGGTPISVPIQAIFTMAANDYIEIKAFCTALENLYLYGGALSTAGITNNTRLTWRKIA